MLFVVTDDDAEPLCTATEHRAGSDDCHIVADVTGNDVIGTDGSAQDATPGGLPGNL